MDLVSGHISIQLDPVKKSNYKEKHLIRFTHLELKWMKKTSRTIKFQI